MSVVVAVKDGEKVWVTCDSQVSMGWTKSTLTNKNNFKICKPMSNENLIIGLVGDLRDLNILSIVDDYIDELTILKDAVDFKYIVKTVVPKIFTMLKDNNRLKKVDDLYQQMHSMLLFVYKNKIFSIHSDGSVIEHDDYYAIGSGQDFAQGNMNETTIKDKKQIAINAVKSACKSDLYVGYPIVVMNTVNSDIEIIEK